MLAVLLLLSCTIFDGNHAMEYQDIYETYNPYSEDDYEEYGNFDNLAFSELQRMKRFDRNTHTVPTPKSTVGWLEIKDALKELMIGRSLGTSDINLLKTGGQDINQYINQPTNTQDDELIEKPTRAEFIQQTVEIEHLRTQTIEAPTRNNLIDKTIETEFIIQKQQPVEKKTGTEKQITNTNENPSRIDFTEIEYIIDKPTATSYKQLTAIDFNKQPTKTKHILRYNRPIIQKTDIDKPDEAKHPTATENTVEESSIVEKNPEKPLTVELISDISLRSGLGQLERTTTDDPVEFKMTTKTKVESNKIKEGLAMEYENDESTNDLIEFITMRPLTTESRLEMLPVYVPVKSITPESLTYGSYDKKSLITTSKGISQTDKNAADYEYYDYDTTSVGGSAQTDGTLRVQVEEHEGPETKLQTVYFYDDAPQEDDMNQKDDTNEKDPADYDTLDGLSGNWSNVLNIDENQNDPDAFARQFGSSEDYKWNMFSFTDGENLRTGKHTTKNLTTTTHPTTNHTSSSSGSTVNNTSTTKKKKKKKKTTTSTKYRFDVEKFLDLVANLTYDYYTNLTGELNDTLIKLGVPPTCPTPTTPTTTTTPKPRTRPDYSLMENKIMGKCYVCGLEDEGVPWNARCSDAFAGDFLPLTPVDASAKGFLSKYRKYCRYDDVDHYVSNATMPRTIFGRWTGGCGVRWTDISSIYTQRTCRNRNHPTTGRHYASKRMAKLEMALANTENGCIVSPAASLIPLSRGISLYARFHACVCTGSWCNLSWRTDSDVWMTAVIVGLLAYDSF